MMIGADAAADDTLLNPTTDKGDFANYPQYLKTSMHDGRNVNSMHNFMN